MAVVKSLDDYIRELELQESSKELDADGERLFEEVVELRKRYEEAKLAYDQAASSLVQLMWESGIKKREVGDIIIGVDSPEEVGYQPELAEALKPYLSDHQWEECFEPQPPKLKKRGINRLLGFGGKVAEIIESHQIVRKRKPVPSALRFTTTKKED